jgi:hypothetical protein
MQQGTNFLVIYHEANKFVRLQVMKAYEGVEECLHTFLKSTLERTQ